MPVQLWTARSCISGLSTFSTTGPTLVNAVSVKDWRQIGRNLQFPCYLGRLNLRWTLYTVFLSFSVGWCFSFYNESLLDSIKALIAFLSLPTPSPDSSKEALHWDSYLGSPYRQWGITAFLCTFGFHNFYISLLIIFSINIYRTLIHHCLDRKISPCKYFRRNFISKSLK